MGVGLHKVGLLVETVPSELGAGLVNSFVRVAYVVLRLNLFFFGCECGCGCGCGQAST